jgi:hypothetical protein
MNSIDLKFQVISWQLAKAAITTLFLKGVKYLTLEKKNNTIQQFTWFNPSVATPLMALFENESANSLDSLSG